MTQHKVIIVFLLLVISCVACPQCYGESLHGGSIVLSTSTDPKTFNPIVAQETSSTQILDLIFDGLTKMDPQTGDIVPHLAERWEHDENGIVWTFYLRRNVQWSDGHEFSSQDVAFTFNQLIYNPHVITGLKSIFTIKGKPVEVSVVDANTVRFKLPSKFAPFLRSLSVPILPKHILSESVINGTFNETWSISETPRSIIGTGPFVIDEYVPGERVVLARNTMYRIKDKDGDRLPYLDNVYFLIVQSEDIALLKFKNQEVDVYGLRGVDYAWLKPLEEKGYFSIFDLGPTMSRYFLTFNQNRGVDPNTNKPYVDPQKLAWFTNKNIRKAIAHCINRDHITDLVFNGLAQPQHSSMSPASGYFYNSDVAQYSFDISKAKMLLAGEGIKDFNNDGVLEDTEGHVLEFNLFISSGSVQLTHLANLVRKDLAEAGFVVNLIQIEFNTLVSKLTYSFDWDMVFMGLTGGIEPHFGANVWFSNGPLHLWYPRQTTPATEWERQIDELFEKGVEELDRTERKIIYDEWQRIIADEVPLVYTVIPKRLSAVNNRLGNIKPTVLGGVLHNIEEIYIKKVQEIR